MFEHICFVGFDSYPVLTSTEKTEYFGGESVQQTLLAKAFTELGYQVSMIDIDYGQPDGGEVEGIRVWKTYQKDAGIPVLRFLHPRLTSITRALKKANAEVYYQSCAGMLTGVVGWFCKRYGRKFVFRTAHDTDCIPGQELIRFWRDRKIYEYGIRRASLIAVQGVKQQELLERHYNLNGVPVNMAVEIPQDDGNVDKDIDVLWVNNLREFKRPEIVLRLAEKLPNYRFVMIGGPCQNLGSYYRKVENKAKDVVNLDFLGHIPYSKVNSYFSRAKVFINTSTIEGFPNSFLQAWAREVPVITFFDPDSLIYTHKLGCAPSNIEEMLSCIVELVESEDRRIAIGKVAKAFAIKRYSPSNVATEYIRLINEILP